MSPPAAYQDDDYDYNANYARPSQPKQQKTIEQTYQKKTQLEHILLRPDTYIGSVQPHHEKMWVLDDSQEPVQIVHREITYVPGFFKIFDEILVNAADNKQRDQKMNEIRITIDQQNNEIQIRNNGRGIQVEWHKEQQMYVPTLIFGHLLTSSNFDDDERKVTGGRNGFGAKLCNVFSTSFTVETSSKESGKQFKQTWRNNMSATNDPEIQKASGKDFTCVTWSADLNKFKGMRSLDDDIVSLLKRRAYDVAASTDGVTVYLNDKKVPVRTFKEYVELFLKGQTFNGADIKPITEKFGDRWEVAVAPSDHGFQQMSFVNSIATTKGGKHVDHIYKLVQDVIKEEFNKKKKKNEADVKDSVIKNHVWVFVKCLIENPTFDSQTKENMTLVQSKFGSKCQFDDKFKKKILGLKILDAVKSFTKFKEDQSMVSKASGKKAKKLDVAKLEDANDAGTRYSLDCVLILTEGDSAKTLAVAGVGEMGGRARDKWGIYPLKGKVLNVREASNLQVTQNKEISELVKILGLTYKKKYRNQDDMKSLRYGKVMIMTDQDQDGSHIKGLLINFIQHNWPELLQLNFLEEFITPIVKVKKKGTKDSGTSFYSIPEFDEWKASTADWHKYDVKYYKGLGTSTSKEAKEYFQDMKRHRIQFQYKGKEDDDNIDLAFSKKKIEERKNWLTNWMNNNKDRKQQGLPEEYLYQSNTRSVTYSDFINKELVLFSNSDNIRSIPSLVDGFKPGQRKVMFTCLKKNLFKEMKVAQLAGSVGEKSAYHHGEMSLVGTIINMAQNFVGRNNINLLEPEGQFGTRLEGGTDHASGRYIFTRLSPLARNIFNQNDDQLLHYLKDDGKSIEPEWYVPILPMVLVNGAEGIGTGWSTKIPNYNPREIVDNLKQLLNGANWKNLNEMTPWYRKFLGKIERLGADKSVVSGVISQLDNNKIEISELPIGKWTNKYKEHLQLMEKDEIPPKDKSSKEAPKKKEKEIDDFKNYSGDNLVKFEVTLNEKQMKKAKESIFEYFGIQTTIATSSMVLFDRHNVLRKYDDVRQILWEFYEVRLDYYAKRLAYLEGKARAEAAKLSNQARFIKEKCENKITVENKKKRDIVELLKQRGYEPDPVKRWRQSLQVEEEEDDSEEVSQKATEETKSDYDYIMDMKLWSLTHEKKNELLKQEQEKKEEWQKLKNTTKEAMWKRDLDEFLVQLEKYEIKQKEDDESTNKKPPGKQGGRGRGGANVQNSMPSANGMKFDAAISDKLKMKHAQAEASKERKAQKKENLNSSGDISMDAANDSFEASLNMDSSYAPRNSFNKMSSQWQVDGMASKTDKKNKKSNYFSNFSDSDNDVEPLEARDQPSRQGAKKKVKYTEDSDDDLEEVQVNQNGNSNNDDDDIVALTDDED